MTDQKWGLFFNDIVSFQEGLFLNKKVLNLEANNSMNNIM